LNFDTQKTHLNSFKYSDYTAQNMFVYIDECVKACYRKIIAAYFENYTKKKQQQIHYVTKMDGFSTLEYEVYVANILIQRVNLNSYSQSLPDALWKGIKPYAK
jgi:hypothetical protein